MERRPETFHLDQDRRADPELNRKTYATSQRRSTLVASFLMLIEEENFGRAAARLHITAPTMTKRIQRLEQQLGVNLLERSARGVLGVTGAGRRFAGSPSS